MIFLKKATLALATLALFAMFSCTAQVKKDIGIQLYSVRVDMKSDPIGTIEKIADMGYTFVETAGYKDGRFYGMSPIKFKELLEKNGLRFVSSHAGQALPDSLGKAMNDKWWDECIAAHAEAGVEYLVQPFMGPEAYESMENLKAYCDYFNEIGEKCNANGIRFGYHNHAKEFSQMDGKVKYDFMLENTDPEKVSFQLDLYWANKGKVDPIDYFKNYPGRFETWHVKDEMEVGGSGMIDFESIFKQAELSGVKYYIVEQEEYKTTALEGVKASFDYLNRADFVK